jgi:hypothetical protein
MKKLAERYSALAPHELDYTELLEETNIFGRGKHLVYDDEARRKLATLIAEAEAREDLTAAWQCLTAGTHYSPDDMKVSCELEYRMFFERASFSHVLYIGSGAYPHIALYVLERDPNIIFDAIDIVPHTTVLCSQLAAKLGYRDRLRPFTGDAMALEESVIKRYDAFFLSSAVYPKNAVIEHLLRHKPKEARIYAREDEAHPAFYEPVQIAHPDVLAARQARALWTREKGTPPPLPEGCEVDH